MIIAVDFEDAKRKLIGKVLMGFRCKSRFGIDIRTNPTLLIVENPEIDGDFYPDVYTNLYISRFEKSVEIASKKLKDKPYTRRVSIPIWMPKDHLSNNPPAITEISYLVVNDKLHLTAYIRSLDCYNYFDLNFKFLSYSLNRISKLSGFDSGTIAMLIGIPHIYERDLEFARDVAYDCKEVYGYTEYGTHIVEDYISSAWHTALETVYERGKEKRTEWEEFKGQEKSLFVHRMFIEVKKPDENKIHDKAPFTEGYCINYTHEYVIYSGLDKPLKSIAKTDEDYTYAERARCCDVDQLYECVKKLKSDRFRRDCYVSISRIEDLSRDNPPCLRGYQFMSIGDTFAGVFYMRSNDVYGAMHANMYAFALLTKYVAEVTGFNNYKYFHFALDAHVYEESLKFVRDILYPDSPKFSDFIES